MPKRDPSWRAMPTGRAGGSAGGMWAAQAGAGMQCKPMEPFWEDGRQSGVVPKDARMSRFLSVLRFSYI